MTSERPQLCTAELIGQPAYDNSGEYLGRVADVVVVRDGDGKWRLREVVVTPRPWGRLLGYERSGESGPWLLVMLARRLLRRHMRRLPWTGVRVGRSPAAPTWRDGA
jgi:hypothetical protein